MMAVHAVQPFKLPVRSIEVPCSVVQGIRSRSLACQAFMAIAVAKGTRIEKFPAIFPVGREIDPETGSLETVCSATKSLV